MNDPGIYKRFARRYETARAAVFLDRDGVIVEEVGYLHTPQDTVMIRSAAAAIAEWNRRGIPVVVVTNQAGVGRAYYTWREFEEVEQKIAQELAAGGARTDGTWACGYHVDGVGELRGDHQFRKPRPGMLLDAAEEMNLDLGASWMVGDKLLDLECAVTAGLKGAVLVRTGYGAEMEKGLAQVRAGNCRIEVAADIGEAVMRIGPL